MYRMNAELFFVVILMLGLVLCQILMLISLAAMGTEATFTLCPSPCPSPCPYQSPCPNNSHFLIKLEAVFRLHQFPYQSPIQCHQISVRSVSIGPPTVKNWYGRPFPSEFCKSLYKITLWRLARQLWTQKSRKLTGILFQCKGTFTLCPCQNQFQYPLQFPCPSHRLHWIRIPVSFRLNFMSTTASPDVKVWFCIGTCKIRMETDVRISFSRSGDRSKRNGR